MEAQEQPIVAIGVDGARGGWVAAYLRASPLDERDQVDGHARAGWQTALRLFGDIEELAAFRRRSAPEAPVCIDVPIGLPDRVGYRPCDLKARERLGRRASSVFTPPARYLLDVAGDYAKIRARIAEERNRNPAEKGMSAQAAGIAPKVREVDTWVREHPESEDWLLECHPEVSFHKLDPETIRHPKASAVGLARRLLAIKGVFRDALERIASLDGDDAGGDGWRKVGASDVLDAYAALFTAVRCARGEAEPLGNEGDRDSAGVVMRIMV
jgi:predicted RNase H-like nuclease